MRKLSILTLLLFSVAFHASAQNEERELYMSIHDYKPFFALNDNHPIEKDLEYNMIPRRRDDFTLNGNVYRLESSRKEENRIVTKIYSFSKDGWLQGKYWRYKYQYNDFLDKATDKDIILKRDVYYENMDNSSERTFLMAVEIEEQIKPDWDAAAFEESSTIDFSYCFVDSQGNPGGTNSDFIRILVGRDEKIIMRTFSRNGELRRERHYLPKEDYASSYNVRAYKIKLADGIPNYYLSRTSSFTYDDQDRIVSILTSYTNAEGKNTSYKREKISYESKNGNLEVIKENEGSGPELVLGPQKSKKVFNRNGLLIAEGKWNNYGGGFSMKSYQYEWDSKGNWIKRQQYSENNELLETIERKIEYF